jgi:hypothetical protein
MIPTIPVKKDTPDSGIKTKNGLEDEPSNGLDQYRLPTVYSYPTLRCHSTRFIFFVARCVV